MTDAGTMTDAPSAATDIDAETTTDVSALTAAPALTLRLLGAAGSVCVDGVCSVEPTVATDPQ